MLSNRARRAQFVISVLALVYSAFLTAFLVKNSHKWGVQPSVLVNEPTQNQIIDSAVARVATQGEMECTADLARLYARSFLITEERNVLGEMVETESYALAQIRQDPTKTETVVDKYRPVILWLQHQFDKLAVALARAEGQ